MNQQDDGAGRKRKGSFHHGNLADALVVAAQDLIVVRGAAGFSLREVAEKVGVSHAAAYRHFGAKADLLAEIAVRGFRDLLAVLKAESVCDAAGSLDCRQTLMRMGAAYIEFALAHPGAYRVLYHPDLCDRSLYPLLAAAAADTFICLAEVIGTGCATGAIRIAAAPEVLASAFWAALHGHSSLLLDRQIREPDGTPGEAPPGDRSVLLNLMVDALFAG